MASKKLFGMIGAEVYLEGTTPERERDGVMVLKAVAVIFENIALLAGHVTMLSAPESPGST